MGSHFIGIFILSFIIPITSFAKLNKFPNNFKWCVATAAHQIEGDNINSDWWAFEHVPGNIARGEKSGKTCDHWNRLEEDITLIKKLNVKTYRFSIEWAKIEPREGQWNQEAISHYKQELATLKRNGIEPMLTLHHFSLPNWVVQKGSWEWSGFPQAFKKYTEVVVTQIAPDVHDWITFNEPMVLISGGYMGALYLQKEKIPKRLRSHSRASLSSSKVVTVLI